MISLRYHVISLGAVFIALALGVVLGSTTLSNSLLSGVSGQKVQLAEQIQKLQEQEAAQNANVNAANNFATAIAPKTVKATLANRTIALITTPNTNKSDEAALKTLLKSAGAVTTEELNLTEAFSDPNRADQLTNIITQSIPAGAQLPVASDPGTLAGGLLGDLLLLNKQTNKPQATPQERVAALTALATAGFIKEPTQTTPAHLAIILTGGAQTGEAAGDRATMLARFATQLKKTGAGAVLAGNNEAATAQGPIAVVRADQSANQILSTVDNENTPAGRITTILALQEQQEGKTGAYGTTGTATAPTPQPTNS
jgi:hypothetical protein